MKRRHLAAGVLAFMLGAGLVAGVLVGPERALRKGVPTVEGAGVSPSPAGHDPLRARGELGSAYRSAYEVHRHAVAGRQAEARRALTDARRELRAARWFTAVADRDALGGLEDQAVVLDAALAASRPEAALNARAFAVGVFDLYSRYNGQGPSGLTARSPAPRLAVHPGAAVGAAAAAFGDVARAWRGADHRGAWEALERARRALLLGPRPAIAPLADRARDLETAIEQRAPDALQRAEALARDTAVLAATLGSPPRATSAAPLPPPRPIPTAHAVAPSPPRPGAPGPGKPPERRRPPGMVGADEPPVRAPAASPEARRHPPGWTRTADDGWD